MPRPNVPLWALGGLGATNGGTFGQVHGSIFGIVCLGSHVSGRLVAWSGDLGDAELSRNALTCLFPHWGSQVLNLRVNLERESTSKTETNRIIRIG